MKILLWSDMEGPSGVDDLEMFADAARYETAKGCATQDVNAAIRGIRQADANAEIDIFDGHGMGDNLLKEELEPGCNLLGGGWMTRLYEMVQSREVAKYDAVLLLGQHAAEGTADGFMSHTNTGDTALRVNGKDVGEAPQLAWLFGHFNIPVVLVVGDDAVVREANALLPGIATVSVKKAIARDKARSMPIKAAHELICEASRKTVRSLEAFNPHRVALPVRISIMYSEKQMASTAARFPRMERTGANEVTYVADDYLEGWLAYNTCRVVSRMHILEDLLMFLAKALADDMQQVRERKKEWEKQRRKRIEGEHPFPLVRF
ncbi:MAG: M55 family metallopeptidase [Candidatus Bathyarchaeota archaeon]|nr:MAG: M55 family metallopeptidase [Candidatus Bathyarchaeota archaeon]